MKIFKKQVFFSLTSLIARTDKYCQAVLSKTVLTTGQEIQQTQEKLDFWEEKKHYEVFEVTCIGWSFEKLT